MDTSHSLLSVSHSLYGSNILLKDYVILRYSFCLPNEYFPCGVAEFDLIGYIPVIEDYTMLSFSWHWHRHCFFVSLGTFNYTCAEAPAPAPQADKRADKSVFDRNWNSLLSHDYLINLTAWHSTLLTLNLFFFVLILACFWADCGGGTCNKTSPFTHTCECQAGYYNILNVSAFPCFRDCKDIYTIW